MMPRFIPVAGASVGHVLVSNQANGPARLVAMNVTRAQFRAPIGRPNRPGTEDEFIEMMQAAADMG